ncbi:MAG: hypothetical protein CL903_03580 [Dehalococcoidia bacterium]|nr:hypothetical protein [Dehalococcoidia bacterium]|tara:strand:- start:952 stop:1362 length:411 start_codon:yes stop_codon:yes gene_type:complete
MKIVITNINKLTLDLGNFLSNESEKNEVILLSNEKKYLEKNLENNIKILNIKNDIISTIINSDFLNEDIIICNFDNNYENNIVAQSILASEKNVRVYLLVSDDSLIDIYKNNENITVININKVINNLIIKTISQEQ